MVAGGINIKILNAGSGFRSVMVQDYDTLNLNSLIKVNPFRIEIIPPSSGVKFYRDGIVFLSDSRSEEKMLESHTSFGTVEAYYAALKDTSIGNRTIFSSSSSWSVPCEAMTFNGDYSVMYYTKIPSKRETEKIFEAKYQIYKNGKTSWISENKPLSFCSDKSVYTHPALSPDGEKMVFVSDTRGSVGGLDLFISYKEGNDWSTPINLGNFINTQGNEMYPFLDQENNLFFSSDGIKGLGGYDIFFCRYNGRGWDKPINLTQIINTPEDDLAFTLSRLDGKTAFYSTRKKTGNRAVQLLRITFRNQYALNNLTNLSDTFKYLAQAGVLAYETEITAENVKPEAKQPGKKPEIIPVRKQVEQETRQEPAEPVIEEAPPSADAIIYRVQFLSSAQSKGSYEISIGGMMYETFEYLYAGAYRSCAGEFYSPAPALDLQNHIRQSGYSDAFIVAFRNNERLTGSMLALARSQQQAGQKPVAEAVQSQKPDETVKKPVMPVTEVKPTTGDQLIYRVQFLSSSQPKGIYEITAGGTTYNTSEYFYSGAYRSCAGDFSSREPANNLREVLRREGYSDAFVVAFINNERVTDPALFR